MLSALQQQVASIIDKLPEAREFVLAGGAALIARGDVQRRTEVLDFFGLDSPSVDRLLPAAAQAIQEAGFEVRVMRAASGFARLSVQKGHDRTEVDLAADARLLPAELGPLGKTLAGQELAVDKVLAVFGRAEARDFVDLLAVEPRYGLAQLCHLAKEKDPGFDVAVFAEMLGRFQRLRREEFERDAGGSSAYWNGSRSGGTKCSIGSSGISMTAIEVLRMTSRWGFDPLASPGDQSSRCRGGVKRGLGRHARWVVPVAGWAGGGGEGGI